MKDTEAVVCFQLGSFLVDVAGARVIDNDGNMHVLDSVQAILLHQLSLNAGELVDKQRLLASSSKKKVISNEALAVAFRGLQSLFGEDPRNPRLIEFIPRQGYRMLAEPQQLPHSVIEDWGVSPGDSEKKSRLLWLAVGLAALVAWLFLMQADNLEQEQQAVTRLAVMPLSHLSQEEDLEVFSYGLGVDLADTLNRKTDLQVLPPKTMAPYRATSLSAQQLGRNAGASLVLAGALQRQDEELVISLNLIDCHSDETLWTKVYRRPSLDLYALRSELVHDLLKFLKPGNEKETLSMRLDTRAYHAYLRGLYLLEQGDSSEMARSAGYLRLSHRQAPHYVPTYAALAQAHVLQGNTFEPPFGVDHGDAADQFILEGLALDDEDGRLLLYRGIRSLHGWQWGAAQGDLLLALEQLPTDPQVLAWVGSQMALRGAMAEGLEHVREAARLDPYGADSQYHYAWMLYLGGVHATARNQVVRVLALDPGHWQGHLLQLWLNPSVGRDNFLQAYKDWLEGLGRAPGLYAQLYRATHTRHLTPRGRRRMLRRDQMDERLSPVVMARLCVAAGNHGEALNWLQKAIGTQDPEIIWLSVDPLLGQMSGEARFQRMLSVLGLKRQGGAAIPLQSVEKKEQKT